MARSIKCCWGLVLHLGNETSSAMLRDYTWGGARGMLVGGKSGYHKQIWVRTCRKSHWSKQVDFMPHCCSYNCTRAHFFIAGLIWKKGWMEKHSVKCLFWGSWPLWTCLPDGLPRAGRGAAQQGTAAGWGSWACRLTVALLQPIRGRQEAGGWQADWLLVSSPHMRPDPEGLAWPLWK